MVITKDEVYRLRECIRELSEYHNKVSVNFTGSYPSRPFDATLEIFAKALERKTSRIEAVEVDGEIAGFCKVVDGNKAVYLYEKYGFKMNAHIMKCIR